MTVSPDAQDSQLVQNFSDETISKKPDSEKLPIKHTYVVK
jgi:hypothetical protein